MIWSLVSRGSKVSRAPRSGFTLLEMLMTVALVGILATTGVTVVSDYVNQRKYEETVAELELLRDATLGDATKKKGGKRSDFGFVGDIGSIPYLSGTAGINLLLSNNGVLGSWTNNDSVRFGYGWNGPYLPTVPGADYTRDAWGNLYYYLSAVPTICSSAAAYGSLGADGALGGTGFDQDIYACMPANQIWGTVYGFVTHAGEVYSSGFQIEWNTASSAGTLVQPLDTIAAGANGYFSRTLIPYGERSLTIYIPTKAAATQTIGPVKFIVDNSHYLIPTASDDGTGYGPLDIETGGPLDTVLLFDNFDRADSASVGGGWTEWEDASNVVKLESNELKFDTSSNDNNFRPTVWQAFTSQTSGIVEWRFNINFARTGTDPIYALIAQIGDNTITDGNLWTGVAASVFWGFTTGFLAHESLAYDDSGWKHLTTLSGSGNLVKVTLDVSNNVYSVTSNGVTHSNIAFRNNVDISRVRFMGLNLLNGDFSPSSIDNVSVVSK